MSLQRAIGFLVLVVSSLSAAAGFELQPGTQVLEPFTYKALSVYPVVQVSAEGNGDQTKYLTLKEGLKAKQVSVREMGSNAEGTADVNHVRVKNNSDRPLLLLTGELILGGQQDRVISVDTILEPKSTRVVQVFCVEHGRWSGQGQFSQVGGVAEGKVRLIARSQGNQSGVWDQVAKKTSALNAASSTGTYRTLATGKEGEAVMKPYRAEIGDKIAAHPDAAKMIGLMTAVNGNILSLEVFASPSMFSEYREQLLSSAYLDAAGLDLKPAAAAPTGDSVKAWVKANDAAPAKAVDDSVSSGTQATENANSYGTTLKAKSGRGQIYKNIQTKSY